MVLLTSRFFIAEQKTIEALAKAKEEAEAAAAAAKAEADAAAAKAKEEADALAKAKDDAEAAKAAAEAAIPPPPPPAPEEKKKPIKFKDAVGRKFNFPFHLCNTWMVCCCPYLAAFARSTLLTSFSLGNGRLDQTSLSPRRGYRPPCRGRTL